MEDALITYLQENFDDGTIGAGSEYAAPKGRIKMVSEKPPVSSKRKNVTTVDTGDDVEEPGTPLASLPFTDVVEGAWFYSDVSYVWEKDLMEGMSESQFGPNALVTRGMVVTVLYRLEGSPDISDLDNPFDDVADGKYYTDAVIWAADKKIVLGFNESEFGPDLNITREQLAAILHHYQQYTDKIPPDAADAKVFADASSISGYAKDSVSALVMQGIINGKPNNKFDPKGNATRAEFAAMLHRYLLAIEEAE